MKYIIIFILSINYSISQNIKVSYVEQNNISPNSKSATLFSNNLKSIYILHKQSFVNDSPIIEDQSGEISVIGKYEDISQQTYLKELNSNLIYKKVKTNKSYVVVKDSIPPLKWNINYTDQKKIGKYNCNKATVNFRGRNYIAWYSTDIPFISGPWKFGGLPGLILEVYNTENDAKYSWIATNIEFPYQKNVDYKSDLKSFRILSKKEEVKLNNDYTQKQLNMRKARVNKNENITFSEIKNSGIELIYEWEGECEE
ncbi:GLPGLI family protein [Aureivirga sp. CE67]|uniref:GLPGLI family protein n=1 Tax=Aureivirga sp. CE67 TaxID=1788983 RepID=UPI0018C93856|nr:GLPGLI family protein [Aureivirga sp. CE67]